jgi:hypothetical protein
MEGIISDDSRGRSKPIEYFSLHDRPETVEFNGSKILVRDPPDSFEGVRIRQSPLFNA